MQYAGRVRPVHRLSGFCLLLKKEAIQRVGYLDERFEVGNYEDVDYCLRLRQAGYELVVAEDTYVHHSLHRTFRSLHACWQRATVNREVLIDKWCRKAMQFLDELDPYLEGFLPSKQ